MFEIMDHPVKTIDVYKLSEFIEIMSNGMYENYYYRGECKIYENNICSTLLRNFTKPNKNYIYDLYRDILNEYYREVANSISEVEKEHFIAFCQHHGLKTNLIDITTSPIIALYFACDMNNEYISNNLGYMYLIDKDKCIDISNSLMKTNSDNYIVPFFLEEISHDYSKRILEFAKVIRSYISTGNGEIFNLSNQLKICCEDLPEECETKKYLSKIRDKTKDVSTDQLRDILDEIQYEYSLKYNLDEITTYSAKDFIILLKLYLDDIILQSIAYGNNNFIFPKLPYLTYQTPYKFDRIKNQEALFIYQLYLSTSVPDMEIQENMIQNIEPDVIIRVHNQEKIMKELDSIGINRKMIYGDVDNIAKYINDKFMNDIR